MRPSFTDYMDRLRGQLLGPLGKLSAEVRREILDGRIVEGALNAFVVRVRANANTVTHQDIEELTASGLDEDEIFDATVCAAFLAGAERYQAVLSAMNQAQNAP